MINCGVLFISGGELVLEDGARLENNPFINVERNGHLVLAGSAAFTPGEYSAIVLDQTQVGDTSLISGTQREWIDASVCAASHGEYNQMIHSTGYRTLMIYVSDAWAVCEIELFPDGVTVYRK